MDNLKLQLPQQLQELVEISELMGYHLTESETEGNVTFVVVSNNLHDVFLSKSSLTSLVTSIVFTGDSEAPDQESQHSEVNSVRSLLAFYS